MVFQLFKRGKNKDFTLDALPSKPSEEAQSGLSLPQSDGFFLKLKKGMSKTRQSFLTGFDKTFGGFRKIDQDLLSEMEEVLISSDVGVKTSLKIIENLSKRADHIQSLEDLKSALKEEMLSSVQLLDIASIMLEEKPHVIMIIGVNGVGKTTTIGKLSASYERQGKKVLIGAADTFRAAAVEQLTVWAQRTHADIIKHRDNADPAAVAFDSIEAALARDADVVLIDTAGRLHTKVNLMEELKKIKRSIAKKIPNAPHETLLVLDATTGQNALSQAKTFHESMDITGLVLAKLDGTSKGGIVVSISNELSIPIKYIGIGENVEDLQPFDPDSFIEALF